MKTLILDGSRAGDPIGKRVLFLLMSIMQSRSWQVENVLLHDRMGVNESGDPRDLALRNALHRSLDQAVTVNG